MATKSYAAGSSAFLEDLLEGEPTFQFTTVKNLERTVRRFYDQNQHEYLVFNDVPYDTFQHLGNDKSSILYSCRFLYLDDTKSLRIRMPSAAHEAASSEFNRRLLGKLGEMNLFNDVTIRHSQLRRIEKVRKQPDGSWGPVVPERYATCVLELGPSQSAHQLEIAARQWLELSDSPQSRIHQVFTIKIDQARQQIIFQKWERTGRAYGRTRSDHPRRAHKTEEVMVSMVNNEPVATGSLRLDFSMLFERPPRPGTSENDIVFMPEDLTVIANEVWVARSTDIA
jgi:hypothetical protein